MKRKRRSQKRKRPTKATEKSINKIMTKRWTGRTKHSVPKRPTAFLRIFFSKMQGQKKVCNTISTHSVTIEVTKGTRATGGGFCLLSITPVDLWPGRAVNCYCEAHKLEICSHPFGECFVSLTSPPLCHLLFKSELEFSQFHRLAIEFHLQWILAINQQVGSHLYEIG